MSSERTATLDAHAAQVELVVQRLLDAAYNHKSDEFYFIKLDLDRAVNGLMTAMFLEDDEED